MVQQDTEQDITSLTYPYGVYCILSIAPGAISMPVSSKARLFSGEDLFFDTRPASKLCTCQD